ncbi:lactation elevated protein 1 homolog B isoform X3 [Stegostoma tigrinum]|uniref:lactation elevated protein 1 homolog B isoform X3 n=1 Tax=Stegostoma tigrinum TaxID=3053191 RepID=UPI00202ADA5D|nr:lactation elevated protein 1 homolog B isoform X3 [Stegostoma tigrinum]
MAASRTPLVPFGRLSSFLNAERRGVKQTLWLANRVSVNGYALPATNSAAPDTGFQLKGSAFASNVEGPLEHYELLVRQGHLKDDDHQRKVVQCLQKLHETLKGYNPGQQNFFSKFFERSIPPKGLYVYGDVGTGKTMMMDLFYSHAAVKRKNRVHFHGFMLDVHRNLYKSGLQRANFVPFIAVLKKYCEAIQLNSEVDYRKRQLPGAGKLYYLTSEADVEAVVDKLFDELAQKQNDITRPRILKVQGRELRLSKACGTLADCTFEELCDKPLGASDYLEMTKHFDTVFIRNIPTLTLAKKTQARRFITLIDAFYDHKVRVVCSAAVPLERIFVQKDHDSHEDDARVFIDDLGLEQTKVEDLSIFSGAEEIFAFQRTVSRLTEMQTEQYWNDGDRGKKDSAE